MTAGEPFEYGHQTTLTARIVIEQEGQPASIGNLTPECERALEDALADLYVRHVHGQARISSVDITIEEGGTP
jgi:hypothetical protein